ncbi:MAG: DNA translocase FtsK [Hyphomicrobiaceae bacterium]|nr:DNA translocase FtsK [Hyphomicrobiaceae bacterium]
MFNAQRAGAATGLLLFAGGFAALSHALGVAYDDVVEAVRRSRGRVSPFAAAQHATAEPTPFGRFSTPDLELPDDAHAASARAAQGAMARALDAARQTMGHVFDKHVFDKVEPRHATGLDGGLERGPAPDLGHQAAAHQPVVHYPPLPQHAQAPAEPQLPLHAPYVPPHPPGPGLTRTPLRGPAATLHAPRAEPNLGAAPSHAQGHVHVRSFDDDTDAASRAIAQRFAPAGHTLEEVTAHAPMRDTEHATDHADAAPSARGYVTTDGNGAQPAHAPLAHTPVAQSPAAQSPALPYQATHSQPPRSPVPNAHPSQQTAQLPAGQQVKRNALFGGLTFRHQGEPVFRKPQLNLLRKPVASKAGPELAQTALRGNARLLEDVLADFGVKGEIRDIRPGPVVTLFEVEPARGTKSSRVIGLADDIARSMSANAVRVAVVPGRNAIGIELPNPRRETVLLRELLEADAFKSTELALPVALGKAIGGEPIIADLTRMPHLLVAGTTGSGKSVGVNAMILSLLYKLTPDECRFIMIDPKMLELSVYNGIPHLLTPVVTDPLKAVAALNWAVTEMEERYKRMAKLSVRNIDVFNNRVRNAKKRGEMLARTVQTGFDRRTGEAIYEQERLELEPMPYIVVVIDEFADLMLVAGKEVEAAVQRLAQMARAAGIHIIMATQRPSVDVITGTIKANFPTRISFKVTSKIDSRTILNEQGAEQLLGQGDMLYASGTGQLLRVHGPFVADEEVEAIAAALRENGPPDYIAGIAEPPAATDGREEADEARGQSEQDLYDRAVAIVLRDRKASTSYIQRRLSIGYNRAADLIERMEKEGVIGPANAVGRRDILLGAGGAVASSDVDAA